MDALELSRGWPAGWDWVLLIVAGLGVVGLTILGYVGMAVDYRAYLRSLRRALVPLLRRLPGVPEWALRETPHCLAIFGLRFPCTLEELKRAYLEQVKEEHPDRGGDQRRFMRLQRSFEEAVQLLSAERN